MNNIIKKTDNRPTTFGSVVDELFQNNLNRFFDDRTWGFNGLASESRVPVNIRETDTAYEVEVIAPGLKKEQFQLSYTGDTLTISFERHDILVRGKPAHLAPKEFAILECLASDPGRVVSRQEMLERAWDEHWYGPTKVLDVHMAALRKKLGDPNLIETVYGHGFRLADQNGTP